MTLAALASDRLHLSWVAVGNVEAAVLRPHRVGGVTSRRSVLPRAGVLGDRLPPLRESTVDLAAGDTLIAATDGLSPALLDAVDLSLEPHALARTLHRDYARADDDALVLVARGDAPDT